MDRQKLIHQLFVGKVAEVLGMEKTTELLKEAKEAFSIPSIVQQSEIKHIQQRKLLNGFIEHIEDTVDFFPCEPNLLIDEYLNKDM